jgi:hypothetical protein
LSTPKFQKLPKAAKGSYGLPPQAKGCQWLPKVAKATNGSQKLP